MDSINLGLDTEVFRIGIVCFAVFNQSGFFSVCIMSDPKVHFGSGGVRALEISNFLFAPPLTSPEYTLNILS